MSPCIKLQAASANVETVFSGAGRLADSAVGMGDDLLAAYVFCHYNWQFPFLRVSDAEIMGLYGELQGMDFPITQPTPIPDSAA